MKSEAWQDAAIEQIQSLFAAAPNVVSVALFGSSRYASALRDAWSDLDVLVVVETSALLEYYPQLDWIKALGELYTYEQSSNPFTCVTRCCFRDGRKIDFVFATADAVENRHAWPQIPWWNGVRVLFSRSEAVRTILEQTSVPPAPALMKPEAFTAMIHSFRFKGLLAIDKIARNDLLIALHLVLEMQQDCCVLGMILRDRAEGTSHHREGGIGNRFAIDLQASQFPYTANGLLNAIEQSSLLFDSLASEWTKDYSADNAPLMSAIQKARNTGEQ